MQTDATDARWIALSDVVLLDALGTLVALEPPASRLRARLAESFAIDITEAEAEGAIAAEFAYYRAHLDEGRDAETLAELRGRCAEAMRAALPPKDSLAALDNASLTRALLESLRFDAYPDAAPALEAARARGQRLVVVSNWDVSLHQVLGRVGLAPLLDGVLTSAELGVRKPSPLIFERALALAEARAEDAVHVGDSLEEDVRGARNAGIKPVLLRRNGSPGPEDVVTISSLAELA
jgi:putative hydrolase of the HAD superfamily